MFTNSSAAYDVPPLPSYELRPLPSLLSFMSDANLAIFLPIFAYWLFSGFFHIIDTLDLFPQYRLHTPAEIVKRNHVSRWECFRDVVFQQVLQVITVSLLNFIDPPAMMGKDDFNVASWARWVRIAQRAIPKVLGVVGVDALQLANNSAANHPMLAGVLAGGNYPLLQQLTIVDGKEAMIPQFAGWELTLASAIYWYIVPAVQFLVAIIILDTWQYFWHRGMHLNKWLYNTFHSRHHRLYVPYAYGALYNHPLEGFVLDIAGSGLAYLLTGMTCRQATVFYTLSTFKTVDDHCGYVFPWDPLQHITGNNAGYHDIHHQSWGIKTNFSQPFFTFWDGFMGTMWTGGDVSARYERTRKAAEEWYAKEQYAKKGISGTHNAAATTAAPNSASPSAYSDTTPSQTASLTSLPPTIPAGPASAQAASSRAQILADPSAGPRVLAAEAAEELDAVPFTPRRSQRGATRKARSGSGSLKGLKDRMVAEGLGAGGMRARMESS